MFVLYSKAHAMGYELKVPTAGMGRQFDLFHLTEREDETGGWSENFSKNSS